MRRCRTATVHVTVQGMAVVTIGVLVLVGTITVKTTNPERDRNGVGGEQDWDGHWVA